MGTAQVNNVVMAGGSDNAPNLIIPENALVLLGYKTLMASYPAPAANNVYEPFYDLSSGSAAVYQVPAGKTFHVVGIGAVSTVLPAEFTLVTATAAIAPGDTSLTGGVYMHGQAAGGGLVLTTSAVTQNWSLMFALQQNLFPGIHAIANGGTNHMTVWLIGKEIG